MKDHLKILIFLILLKIRQHGTKLNKKKRKKLIKNRSKRLQLKIRKRKK